MRPLLPILLFAGIPLSACSPATDAPLPEPSRPAAGMPPAAAPVAADAAAPQPQAQAARPGEAGAWISGAIRDGNRPPPALRICAHPLDGGAPTCADSPAGATGYRLEVAPGRYYVMGWVRAGELTLIAHATQVRCIRAPCPPDALIEVAVAAGEDKAGVDLSGAYLEVPVGWPPRP